MLIRTKRGFDLPIMGAPEQSVHAGASVGSVALLGPDYLASSPPCRFRKASASAGPVPFYRQEESGCQFHLPGSGVVEAVNRGPRRVLHSVVIRLGAEGSNERERFDQYDRGELANLSDTQVRRAC